jgi:transcriptional regulator with XRE-family HTH domain
MGELATMLRAWRDRLTPLDVGLPSSGLRRAAGLRREELAGLAGLSVDYVVRLEQGRADTPSAQVVAALGRALQLSRPELDHLYRAAHLLPPTPTQVPTHITPGVQRLLLRLTATPVAVYTAAWTLVSANPLWLALFGDQPVAAGRDSNLVWRRFALHAPSLVREHIEDRRRFEAGMVADLRAVANRYAGDPELHAMLADLKRRSADFRTLWQANDVAQFHAERKTIQHRQVGDITLDCDVLTAPGTDLRIVAYTAVPGTEDASKLDLLGVSALAATGQQV